MRSGASATLLDLPSEQAHEIRERLQREKNAAAAKLDDAVSGVLVLASEPVAAAAKQLANAAQARAREGRGGPNFGDMREQFVAAVRTELDQLEGESAPSRPQAG